MPDEREESTGDAGPEEPQSEDASTQATGSDGAVDEPNEGDRIPGEGGLSYDGSPDSDRDVPGESDEGPATTDDESADDGTTGGSDSATGAGTSRTSEPVPTASAGTATGGTSTGTEIDDVGGISTPPDDEEMPLADHIEEMVSRLAVVLLVGAAGTAIGILWATDAIGILWAEALPQAEEWPPHLYSPLELWMTRIKVASLLGVIVALPVFVYESYLFMRPGLYPHERRYYLAAVPTSVVLGAIGMLFSYLLVLPVLFQYFTYYAEGSAEIKYALGETFNLIITLTAFLAIVFQIPLFIMLAVMMGVTTRRWLAEKRLYFWGAFAALAFTFTIDPTAMAAGLVAITMILLFEGTLALLKWTGVE